MANKTPSLLITQSPTALKIPLTPSELNKLYRRVLAALESELEMAAFVTELGKAEHCELRLCDDVEMRVYQKSFRKLNRTTDILSFPSLESPAHCERGFIGSLVISPAQVQKNARRYRRTFKKELSEVFVHGLLHLFGFDHIGVSAPKRARMRAWQKHLAVME